MRWPKVQSLFTYAIEKCTYTHAHIHITWFYTDRQLKPLYQLSTECSSIRCTWTESNEWPLYIKTIGTLKIWKFAMPKTSQAISNEICTADLVMYNIYATFITICYRFIFLQNPLSLQKNSKTTITTRNKSIVPCWTMHIDRMSCHSTKKGVNY